MHLSIEQSPSIKELQSALKANQSLLIEELWNSPKALIIALASQITGKNVLVITGASAEENRLLLDFPVFTDTPVIDFPPWETLPHENIAPNSDTVGERYQALKQIQDSASPQIVIAVLQACLQKVISPVLFKQDYLELAVGTVISFEQIKERLDKMGYQRQPIAEDKGQFAIRGGIIDIFPISSPSPYRLEFFGDEIESIRIYDPISQISTSAVQSVDIAPGLEFELLQKQERTSTLLDYLGPNTLVVIDDLLSVEDRAASLKALGGVSSKYFASFDELLASMNELQKIYFSPTSIEELSSTYTKSRKGYYSSLLSPLSFSMFNQTLQADRWRHPFIRIDEYFSSLLEQEQDDIESTILEGLKKVPAETSLIVIEESDREVQHFLKKIEERIIGLPAQTSFKQAYLSVGCVIEDSLLILLPLTEFTHRYKVRRQKLRSAYHSVSSYQLDLSPGDLVVHLNNGIGKFLGVDRRANHLGYESEFFILEYAEHSKLFVPIQQAHLITKYIGASEEIPQLHTLGSSRWKKIKENTQKAIVGYAKDLLELYAQRQLLQGFAYRPDSEEMHAFEQEFPFVETQDQLTAIQNVKQDMISTKPMDRLICGDVGYGKTEVAMRAAFKAVVDGNKQVAILVPTTVLATQHYENFIERMRNFPIEIGILSRFQSPKQIKETLQRTAEGKVDILIGTHRILSKDVVFKDLGLIVIDEEQRFGVKVKEHLKKIKTHIDCLTLSATPIPRTLYMSLVGARDMSVINTPPENRLPISTVIAEPTDEVIRTAILRELARDGQVFFIHNWVATIYDVSARLQKLLPHARIAVAHGQMSSDELDTIFHTFKNGQADILVATTIVETGINILNANTILIDQADRYGLANLYQMRGRVRAWNRHAYAYLLVKNRRTLSEDARKRLQALIDAGSHGGGVKVAMRDLEIRGAGDILGLDQSGHVAAIGFHFYCKLLKRTVEALQGKHSLSAFDIKIEFPVDARLSEQYINEESLRIDIYQRLGDTTELEEVDKIWNEIEDRFGRLPLEAQWLRCLSRIRVVAGAKRYVSLKWENMVLTTEKKEGSQPVVRKHLLKFNKQPQQFEKLVCALL